MWVFTAKLEDDPESWLMSKGFQDGDTKNLYIVAVYWAFTSLTTVGYGDISANTSIERCLAIMWMVVGVYFFSFTIGSLASILSSIDTKETLITTKFAVIDEFVRDAHLSRSIRNRLRAAVKYNSEKEGYSLADKQDIFYELPRNLRYEVALAMHQGAVKELAYFMEKEHAFVAMIVPFLKHLFVQGMSMVYSKDDYADEVYFLSKGWCGLVYGSEHYLVKKLQRGSYFGDIEVIQGVPRKYSIMAAVDVDLLVMNKKLLATVQREFPNIYTDMVDVASMRDKLSEKSITEHKELLRMKKNQHLDQMRVSEIKQSVAIRAGRKMERRSTMLTKESSPATGLLPATGVWPAPDSNIDLRRQINESNTRMTAIDKELASVLRALSEQREMVEGLLRQRQV
jgi:hyperpolarization activated cyclic nucleotide-gated potassium channel 1